ncbi:hypothetical protein Bbelb_295360 [Branchiostoma belcheri]|nr:hypothetical protein Bbelb_295360 [Branchiostoma belcheri]
MAPKRVTNYRPHHEPDFPNSHPHWACICYQFSPIAPCLPVAVQVVQREVIMRHFGGRWPGLPPAQLEPTAAVGNTVPFHGLTEAARHRTIEASSLHISSTFNGIQGERALEVVASA